MEYKKSYYVYWCFGNPPPLPPQTTEMKEKEECTITFLEARNSMPLATWKL